ncbi:MAG: peptide chain release factor 1 [Acholeplasmataceae bacterium]
MFDRLKLMKESYLKIQDELSKGISDVKKMTNMMKEMSDLEPAVLAYNEYLKLNDEVNDLNELLEIESDQSLIEAFKLELKTINEKLDNLKTKLQILLIPKDPNDGKNIIMEIKGAAGGDEGNIFAGNLFRMYAKLAEERNWKISLINQSPGTMGGFASIEFSISGKNVYSYLKYESGVHRVQRVPETESQGRVHTSTAVVLVLPEQDEIDVDVSWEDIRVDTYNSSGAGGQSVNTTYSAVRLTHIPTGIVTQSQEERSQHENKARAYKSLVTRIYDKILQERLEEEGKSRKELIGTGDRSEKIRTYNYPQNRVTDHRIHLTLNRLDQIMEGRIDLIIDPLINEFQKRAIQGN